MSADADPLALYVHWPFCLAKCPYCDFNSHVADAVDQLRWGKALAREIEHAAAETRDRPLASIFFGGGTPSLMSPDTVAGVIAAAGRWWRLTDEVEITLEANPTSVEAGRFAAYREAGVGRLSLGVQSLDGEALAFLGRGHSAAEAVAAVELARRNFPRTSFDLIYARPEQTLQAWRRELEDALAMAGEHLSLYQLSIEPGTPFFRDGVAAADGDSGAALYELTQNTLSRAGLPAYEISNHARLGAECRHNLHVWRGGDYLGIGPGAHGRVTTGKGIEAQHRIHAPARWLAAVEEKGDGAAKRRRLTVEERAEEILMMGLRLSEGVERARFTELSGGDVEDAVDPEGLGRMIDGGFLEFDATRLRATAAGRLRLDAVLGRLLS